MIPRCGWCGKMVWPWSPRVRAIFGMLHEECATERGRLFADIDKLWWEQDQGSPQ